MGRKRCDKGCATPATWKAATWCWIGDREKGDYAQLPAIVADIVRILDNAFFFAQRATILRLAAESKLPVASGGAGEWAEDGALLSYSADFIDIYRRVAGYVDKVLKGSRPKDLPIQQPEVPSEV